LHKRFSLINNYGDFIEQSNNQQPASALSINYRK